MLSRARVGGRLVSPPGLYPRRRQTVRCHETGNSRSGNTGNGPPCLGKGNGRKSPSTRSQRQGYHRDGSRSRMARYHRATRHCLHSSNIQQRSRCDRLCRRAEEATWPRQDNAHLGCCVGVGGPTVRGAMAGRATTPQRDRAASHRVNSGPCRSCRSPSSTALRTSPALNGSDRFESVSWPRTRAVCMASGLNQ